MHFKRTVLLLFILPLSLFAQNISQMHFQDQPIRDILLTLAEVSGRSIIADDTVDGQASYFFSDTDFDTALDQFLTHYGIFYYFENGTYYVSRIQTNFENESVLCRAENVDLQLLIRRLSRDGGITLLHDALPRERANINFSGGTLEELLEIIITPYPQFYLEKGDRYYYLRKENTTTANNGRSTSRDLFTAVGPNTFSADLNQIRFREAAINLMELHGSEFSFLGRNDNVIEIFRYENKSFDEMLNLLMEQGNADYQLSGDIYYIFDLDRQDILKQYFTTLYIPLENLSVERLSSLIPSPLANSGSFKIDKDYNGIILTGSLKEIEPLEKYIRQLDQPTENRQYRQFNLDFISLDELQKQLPPSLGGIGLIAMGDSSFLCFVSEEKALELEDFLKMADKATTLWPIQLRYLTWEKFKEILPPTFDANKLHPTGDPGLLYFEGSRGKWEVLKSILAESDKPIPQIRYEVLVLQLEDGQGLEWGSDLSTSKANSESSTGFVGSLAGLASLNFDVVNQLGYQFALNLSLNLSQKHSWVLTDTTLHALSGETIRFQNTNTSRHPTTEIDADSGESKVTGFREITSGLIIELTGTVSGDGMITMDVQSTISSQDSGSDGESNSSIPSTTEKVVNTHVRSLSGEPIILSGLKQQDMLLETTKVPFFGNIPLLGLLFQTRTERLINTEFLIVLIPYREEDEIKKDPYNHLYERFVEGDRY